MEATAANFSPLMMLYRDPHGLVAQVLGAARTQTPDADFEVDDEGFSLWRIADRGAVSTITAAVGPQPVYIADGHHRYETALTYRATHPEADTVLTCLIAFDDPGLLIQPYYRVVHGLSDNQLGALRNLLATLFESRPADVEGAAALDAAVAVAGRDQVALGVVQQDEPPALLTLSEEEVPSPANGNGTPAEQARTVEAVVLQEMLLRPVIGDAFPEHMAYVHDPEEALSMVARGEGQVAFFIKGVPPDVFEVVVGAGIRLPRKSTYFHPKLPSGLVVSPLSA